jgi:hypothetical protein
MPEAGDNAANPYAPPSAVSKAPGSIAYHMVRIGLVVYAFFELTSIPLVWRAHALLERSVDLHLVGVGADADSAQAAERAFHTGAAAFHASRALAELGMILAFAAGLVWLYKAWAALASRGRKTAKTSARAVVLWTLVPLYGYWRLYGFLLDIARRDQTGVSAARVGRWWLVMAASIVVRLGVIAAPQLGVFETVDALLAAAAAFLGMRMLAPLQRAAEVRRAREVVIV